MYVFLYNSPHICKSLVQRQPTGSTGMLLDDACLGKLVRRSQGHQIGSVKTSLSSHTWSSGRDVLYPPRAGARPSGIWRGSMPVEHISTSRFWSIMGKTLAFEWSPIQDNSRCGSTRLWRIRAVILVLPTTIALIQLPCSQNGSQATCLEYIETLCLWY